MKQKQLFITGTALALAAALAGCGNTTANQPQSSQQASYISMDAAQSAALDAASIAAADANFSATTLDDVAGITCYKVDFSAGGYDYAYSINAESGEVLEASYHEQAGAAALPDGSTGTTTTQPSTTKPNVGAVTTAPAQTTTPNTGSATGAVDEAKAQEIALAHAGIKAADATITKSKLDYDDGRQVYEIEFYVSGSSGYTEYDYEIEAATGKIVSYDHDAESYAPPAQSTNSGVKVTEATAKKTALSRVSGATEKDIYEWKLDYDDGRTEYEGKIIYGGMEYEFTINAATGAVTEWDAESVYD